MNRRSFLLGFTAVAIVTSAQLRSRIAPDLEVRHILNALGGTDLPVGCIVPYYGKELPEGWLPCDGRVVSSAMFPELFSVLGTAYGDGKERMPAWQSIMTKMFGEPGSRSFKLPDARARSFS